MKKQAPGKTLVQDARQVCERCPGLNARAAARQISKFIDERLKPAGLSLAQFGLLAQIAGARDDTIGGLAERTGLDQSTLSRNLRLLEAEGLIEIVTAEADLRRRAVWLTEQGARRLERAMPAWRRACDELGKLFPLKAVKTLAKQARALD